jgi:hypothetical protein
MSWFGFCTTTNKIIMNNLLLLTGLVFFLSFAVSAQSSKEISQIEFNSGTRGYREQIIINADSVTSILEDSKVDQKARKKTRAILPNEWTRLLECLGDVRLTEVETLESPTMKRAYDGASHGSIIITTIDNKTYTHGFDDEDPHKKLKPLMAEIKKFRKK